MKKIVFIIFCLFLLCGCSIKKEKDNTKKVTDNSKEEVVGDEELKDEYIDTNPIKLGIFEAGGKYSNKEVIKDVYYAPFTDGVDIGSFEVFLTDEENISGTSYKDTWNKYYNLYDDISDYKIGYNIKFILSDGTNYEGTFLEPDIFKFTDYFYVYLYDDIHQEDNAFYSHLEEVNDDTLMTSIKLYAVGGINQVENIILTAFTYKDDNDFKDGIYRGNSRYTIRIKKK